MKKSIYVVSGILLLSFFACKEPKEKSDTSTIDSSQKAITLEQQEMRRSPFQIIECDNQVDTPNNIWHQIDERCMLNLVKNYLVLGKSSVYGGFIPIDKINEDPNDNSGLMYYLCYKDTTPFIAYQVTERDRTNVDSTFSDSDSLYISENVKTIDPKSSMNNLFKEVSTVNVSSSRAKKELGSTIKGWQKDYYTHFNTSGLVTYGYFKRNELITCMAQAGSDYGGLFYFFGYNDSTKSIRIILANADSIGRIIMRDDNGTSVNFFEHAFPPMRPPIRK